MIETFVAMLGVWAAVVIGHTIRKSGPELNDGRW